jgi:hypothetical protein
MLARGTLVQQFLTRCLDRSLHAGGNVTRIAPPPVFRDSRRALHHHFVRDNPSGKQVFLGPPEGIKILLGNLVAIMGLVLPAHFVASQLVHDAGFGMAASLLQLGDEAQGHVKLVD